MIPEIVPVSASRTFVPASEYNSQNKLSYAFKIDENATTPFTIPEAVLKLLKDPPPNTKIEVAGYVVRGGKDIYN